MKKVLITILAAYALLAAAHGFLQDGYIFYRRPPSLERPEVPAGYRLDSLLLTMSDGTHLEGWLVMPSTPKPPLVIYFGGNAEEVSFWTGIADRYAGFALVLVNYRGYGRSEGKPSERTLFSDALEIYDQISRRSDMDASNIVLHGRSLGSGVAVYLASQRPVRAVILTSPFDSVLSIAKKIFPYLPVSIMLRHPFDSLSRAPNLAMPLLCLVSPQDEVIPVMHSQTLFNAWAGGKIWREIPNEGHNTISDSLDYWRAISEFLGKLRE